MHRMINRLTGWISSPKGVKSILIIWIIAIILLSGVAPSSKKVAVSAGEGSIYENTASAIAEQMMDKHFPTDEGLPALVVFNDPNGISDEDRRAIKEMSEWLASTEKPEHVASALPFHAFPESVQDGMMSEDKSTLLFHLSLAAGLDSGQTYETLQQVRDWLESVKSAALQVEITGPAGIAADTLTLFKNADLILLFATIGLILILLIIIYRSPLLALIPLVIAGIVYQVVDRVIGLAGKYNLFIVDKQALSIMLILLFAVLTDYCLFVFSRYREELSKIGNKYDAMRVAMSKVGEPILFSGGTVLIAMLALLAAVFKPYHHFAPVFAIAIVFILLGGLTLIPAVFALLGRKAFWPFIPKLGDKETAKPARFWGKLGQLVVKRRAAVSIVLLAVFVLASLNIATMKSSFNLMKSFPEDLSSRQGYELLEQNFPKGTLAPVTILLTSDKEISLDATFLQRLDTLSRQIQEAGGIDSITPAEILPLAKPDARLPRNFLAEDNHAVKLQMTLKDNPYDQAALDRVEGLRTQAASLLNNSGLDSSQYELHFAGQTASQIDIRQMNMRDMIVTFTIITVLITIMLVFQTRSWRLALIMIFTILLSYLATIGLGWFIFHNMMGYESISYRLPVYTFVFLVALGVDYNIMLVSRIREEAKRYEWKEAISRGVSVTGSVISSAGIILAATFSVLTTQPMQELFLFGLTMAIGVVVDTFLIRGMLLPSILAYIKPKE